MRLRLWVITQAARIPWPDVLRPGRGLAYDLLAHGASDLGQRLHDRGWGLHGMVPFGHGAPVFPGARRRRGTYAAGGKGLVEFGSPLMDVVEGWCKALPERELLDWGGVALRVERVEAVEPPEFADGWARLRTVTPAVMKGASRDRGGNRIAHGVWLLPGEPEYDAFLAGNFRRKAETLGLDPDVSLERIIWWGSKRSFAVKGGAKVGAPVEVELRGAPETLRAIWSWGLGQANAAGFGWVGA